MSAKREQGAQNKFKVRECTFPAMLGHDLQPAIETICSSELGPFLHNI